jgi:endonuclease YncB( thermonuclease family)
LDYRIEIYDTCGRRVAVFDDTPLLEAGRAAPDQSDWVRGMVPQGVADIGPGYRVRVLVAGEVFCEVDVVEVTPEWGDSRTLILDRYVNFHEVVAFEGKRPAREGNTSVSRAFVNEEISAAVRWLINDAPGPVHYLVDHEAYPDGAEREYGKFLARKTAGNELEVGGIAAGQWVGGGRIDATGAYAKDGDTIAGLVVDGEAWPDLRMMMIDTEETSLNSHTVSMHPETADWSEAQYAASGYALAANKATAALQALMDADGIDYIELNPHIDASGEYDDRVDYYGRYIGLVYGGGKCFNAAMVELGNADVYLYSDGAYHVPEMSLKDFYSYRGENVDSIEPTGVVVSSLDVTAGLLEAMTTLAYMAGGFVWSVGPDLAVRFRKPARPDKVCFFSAVETGMSFGATNDPLANVLYVSGNPVTSTLEKTYTRGPSLDAFGPAARRLAFFGITIEDDAENLAEGLLDDVAYPEPAGWVAFHHGNAALRVGDVIEVRGEPVRRLGKEVDGEWGGLYTGRLVGRVEKVVHRFSGKRVSTRVWLTSPLRSVSDPVSFMVRSQPGKETLFEFRLDDVGVGVDYAYHLD